LRWVQQINRRFVAGDEAVVELVEALVKAKSDGAF
jgi:hypothetical protein